MGLKAIALFMGIIFLPSAYAKGGKLLCGLASGYPPYQYLHAGKAAGLDADFLRLIAEKANLTIEFKQGPWDDVVSLLRYGRLDCVGGMEINADRQKIFDFTLPYYERKIVIFVLKANAAIATVQDLVGKKITGDRHSFVERHFEKLGLTNKLRMVQTESKEASMQLLKDGKVDAVTAPRSVGLFLAKSLSFEVKTIEDNDPGSPVAIAFGKGDKRYSKLFDDIIKDLKKQNAFEAMQNKLIGKAD